MSALSNTEVPSQTLRMDVDADGIAVITLDAPGRPMNVVSPEFIDDLVAAIERIAADAAIRGAIITSAKPAFMAGADLKYIATRAGGAISQRRRARSAHRRGRPAASGGATVANLYGLGAR